MVKRRPGVSILPLMLIVILCVSWLTQLNQRDEMTYDEMVQLFEQQKVEAFRFTDSSTLMLQVKGSDQPVRCRIHDYTLFYSDLNDLVKEQKAAGIITSYSYPPPDATNWLEIILPYVVMAVVFAPREVLPGFVVGEHDDHIGLAAPQRDVVAHDFILDRVLQGGVQDHFDPLSADKTHLHDAAAKASVAHHFDNRRRFAGLQFG